MAFDHHCPSNGEREKRKGLVDDHVKMMMTTTTHEQQFIRSIRRECFSNSIHSNSKQSKRPFLETFDKARLCSIHRFMKLTKFQKKQNSSTSVLQLHRLWNSQLQSVTQKCRRFSSKYYYLSMLINWRSFSLFILLKIVIWTVQDLVILYETYSVNIKKITNHDMESIQLKYMNIIMCLLIRPKWKSHMFQAW